MRTQLALPGTWLTVTLVAATLAAPAAIPRAARAQAAQAGAPDSASGKKEKKEKKDKKDKKNGATPDSAKKVRESRFFESQDILPTIVLTSNFGRLRRDRGDNPPWRWATISYAGDSAPVKIPVRVRTRGIWRRKNCVLPPLRVDFSHKDVKGTIFEGENRPKLTVHCRDDGESDQYLLKELLAYRVYQLLTPVSHRARLARMQYVDSASGKQVAARYGVFVESPEEMVNRLKGRELKQQGATPEDLGVDEDALFGLFQYFVGNTDFSVSALHNVELVARDTSVIPVAHDFDWTGLVNARYATPDPRVGVQRVRDRVYRGFCVPPESFARAVERFNAQRTAIYALLTDSVGRLMDKGVAEDSKAYFDEFYQTINNPREFKRSVVDMCLGR